MSDDCMNEYNLFKPCVETMVYGTFGNHSITRLCKYCLKRIGYGSFGAPKAAAQAAQPAQQEFVSPNISEHRQVIEQLLAAEKGSPSDRKFLDSLLNGSEIDGQLVKREYMSVKQRDWLGRILRKEKMPPQPSAITANPVPAQDLDPTDPFNIPF